MASWRSSLESGVHPVVTYYDRDHTVEVSAGVGIMVRVKVITGRVCARFEGSD